MVLNSQLDSGKGHTDARWAHPAGFLERTTGWGRRSDKSKTSGAIVAATRCSTSCLLCLCPPVPRQYSKRRAKVATQNQIAIDSQMRPGPIQTVGAEKKRFTNHKNEGMASLTQYMFVLHHSGTQAVAMGQTPRR